MKPWLLEVNHAPSFNDDTEVDKIVKTDLLTDTFRLLDVKPQNRTKILNNERKVIIKRQEKPDPIAVINRQLELMDNADEDSKYEDEDLDNKD